MKNKNKIDEGALDMGIQSYQTSSSSSSSSANKKPTVMVKQQDLQKTMRDLKGVEADVMVTKEEASAGIKTKLSYLSEVMDSESNEISKPFTIANKRYQMVRAVTPDKQRVMGVYSLDETDESGENVIYSVDDFEQNIAKKAVGEDDAASDAASDAVSDTASDGAETNVIAEPADEVNPQSQANDINGPSFIGFKHYIVNRKTGKARKFKSIEELAKAQMTEDEQYMGIKDFKKYVDEVLFGNGKRQMKETDVAQTTSSQTAITPAEQKMISSAEKLMKLISEKIPSQVIQQIKTNKIAQREVILSFAEMIGVPNSEMQKIIIGLKGMGKNDVGVNEGLRPIIKRIKVKDIK